MNAINITKINLENPLLTSYIKRMSTWGENGAICGEILANQKEDIHFYGIFYDENFLAASVIGWDKEKELPYTIMANGSINHYDEIEKFSKTKKKKREISSCVRRLYNSKKIS